MTRKGVFPRPAYPLATWRRTPAGRRALRAFPGRKVRELAAIVEAGPGFKDPDARREFPRSVRMWACKELAAADEPAGPTPVALRGALGRVERAAQVLDRQLGALPGEAMELLAHRLTWYPGLPSEVVATVLDPERKLEQFPPKDQELILGLKKIEQLAAARGKVRRALPSEVARLAAAAGRARAGIKVSQGRPPRSYRKPLWWLASIWWEATGKAPTFPYNTLKRRRSSAFRTFAYAAAAPVFPGMGGADELIDGVVKEWRGLCAEWRRLGRI